MITSLTLLTLCLAQSAAAQDEVAPAASTEIAWRTFDGVALIVNNDIVTLRQLDESLSKARGNAKATLPKDAKALRDQVIENAISTNLQIQAGRAMGIAPSDVERTIDGFLNRERRGRSATETAIWLQKEGVQNLGAMRDTIRDELYLELWGGATSGQGSGADRPYQDRYVRPGQLREAYYTNKSLMETPSRYILQYLRLVGAAWGDVETALDVATDLHGQIVEGADMGAMVDEYGSFLRASRGMNQDPVPIGAVAPEVREFLQEAERGALSMVLPYLEAGEIAGYEIVRVVELLEGTEAPPFHDANLQTSLQRGLQNSWDQVRVLNASDHLWRAAYIQTPQQIQILPPWVRREAAKQSIQDGKR